MTEIKRIISGGQTGADYGGLLAGQALGIETGGYAPRGWRVDNETRYPDGVNLGLAGFGLMEHETSQYPGRTMANVDAADATIAFMVDPKVIRSVGTNKTVGYCQYKEWRDWQPDWDGEGAFDADTWRPYCVVSNFKSVREAATKIRPFVEYVQYIKSMNSQPGDDDCLIINIAGHRQSSLQAKRPGYDFELAVRDILVAALRPYVAVMEPALRETGASKWPLFLFDVLSLIAYQLRIMRKTIIRAVIATSIVIPTSR